VKVTQAVADQVEATLTAAMVDARCADAVRSGLLVTALASTGVGEVDLSAAVATPEALGFTASPVVPGPPDLHVVPDPDADEKAVAAAQERLAAAAGAATAAEARLSAATTTVDELEARGMQLQAEIDELRGRLAEREAAYEEVDEELSDAEEARSEAEAALAEAARDRDAAEKALAKVQA
jgi:hypothetical protein